MFGLVEVEVSQFDLHPPPPSPGSLLNLKYSDESLFTSSSPDTYFILSNISVSLWTEVKLFRGKRESSNHLQQLPAFWGGFRESTKRPTTREEFNLIKLHQCRKEGGVGVGGAAPPPAAASNPPPQQPPQDPR